MSIEWIQWERNPYRSLEHAPTDKGLSLIHAAEPERTLCGARIRLESLGSIGPIESSTLIINHEVCQKCVRILWKSGQIQRQHFLNGEVWSSLPPR